MLMTWISIVTITNDQFVRAKELLNIIVWPSVVLFGALFFNRVFTYFFFSVRKFNFFGMEGELRDIEDVINEQVESTLRENKNEEEKEKLYKALNATSQQKVILEKAFENDKKRLSELEQENIELKNDLRNQQKEKVGCSLQNLGACDQAGLMKLITELSIKETEK